MRTLHRSLIALAVGIGLLTLTPLPAQAATFTVNSTNDINDGTCDVTHCSLREAINASNATAAVVEGIEFNIAGGGPHVIAPSAALPFIQEPVVIDGTTEPSYAGTPVVELDGTGTIPTGLNITAGDSTVRGLSVTDFTNTGIFVQSVGNNIITASYIGLDPDGVTADGNDVVGISLNSDDNRVGGTATADRNVISGNNTGVGTGPTAIHNEIQGNYIGTTADGLSAIANSYAGVVAFGPSNTIGGDASGAENVISGNGQYGVVLTGADFQGGAAHDNRVEGNFIGLNKNGAALGNTLGGVFIDTSPSNVIGGTSPNSGNVISGNGGHGINFVGSDDTTILGNRIGTNLAGTAAIANGHSGIQGSNSEGFQIGGTTGTTPGGACAGACNLISGNPFFGIAFPGAAAGTIQGNFIGTNAAGTAATFGNGGIGILVSVSTPNGVDIGGTTPAARNLISGNGAGISAAASGTTIRGNFIGTNTTGTAALPNGGGGVNIAGPGTTVGGLNGTPGGSCTGECNLISGNTGEGVRIDGTITAGTLIAGNFIGTRLNGTVDLGNATGIFVAQSTGETLIGGGTPAEGNLISGNDIYGVASNSNTGIDLQGNLIGTQTGGTVALPNTQTGVFLLEGSGSTIGGTGLGMGNTIAHNGGDGVGIASTAGTGNTILGNEISNNADLGIDLHSDGPTPNDIDDLDAGPNSTQNYPVPTAAWTNTATGVQGSLDSTPNTTFRLEFFANPQSCAVIAAEGATFLGSWNVTTDAAGEIAFRASVPGAAPAGQFISATATGPDGTSEFSSCSSAVVSDTTIPAPTPTMGGAALTKTFQTSRTFSISWSGAADGQSGVVLHDVQQRAAGINGIFGSYSAFLGTGGGSSLLSTPDGGATFTGTPGTTVCFQAQALDGAGNASGFGAEDCTAIPLDDRGLTRRRWKKKSGSGHYLGTFVRARRIGARLILKGVTGKQFAILVTKCRTCGKIKVKLGSRVLRRIKLRSNKTKKMVLIPLGSFAAARTGTITIIALSGRPIVDGLGVSIV